MSKTLELAVESASTSATHTPVHASAPEPFLSGSVAPGEIVIGVLSAIDVLGNPLVTYLQSGYARREAVSSVVVSQRHIGKNVALLFVNGNLHKPMIIGFIHGGFNEALDDCSLLPVSGEASTAVDEADESSSAAEQPNLLRVDGKKVLIEGQEEIVLQCGESSITLTKAGKIVIRGKYLVSRSSGVNRILGASVNVN